MSRYITSVQVWFYSEGASPSQVMKKLLELGFRPVRGAYDFIYEHKDPNMSNGDLSTAIVEIADAIHKTLTGFRVLYTLDTHEMDADDETDYIPLDDIDAELEETRKELESIEKEKHE
ncbi:MAG: hypothetical protein JW779_12615 [Candidatus Thorarchaeota archaeon]|nr:hypothetical protein [Candidatus Thorarchaeota archaeon]